MARFDPSVFRNPRWIAAIVAGVLLAALFVRLGIWQLDRLEERRATNVRIEERRETDAVPLDELIERHGEDPQQLIDRVAAVEGEYRRDLEFFSIGRTYGDLTGTLVATPLQLDDGSLLVVVRGIVPSGTDGPPAEGYEPPSGDVTVTGRLDDGEEPLRIGEPDPEGGIITSLSRVDLAYVDRWTDGDVLPISMFLEGQRPSGSGPMPEPIPVDELSEGSHLGYAIQWFGLAAVAVAGTAYLILRAGTREEDEVSESEQERVPLQ